MIVGGFGSVVLAPISEVLAKILVEIAETVSAAKDVLIEQESFSELARYLNKIQPLLIELQEKNLRDTPPLRESLLALEREMRRSQELIAECSSKSRFYLLVSCRSIVKQVQDITQEIGRCLSLIPMASMNLSLETRENATQLLKEMQNAQFKAALAGEEIAGMIETGVKTQRMDSDFSNNLLLQIATSVGVPIDPASLRQELLRFKKEKEEIELHKDQAEAYQLEQIIGILNRADAATTITEKRDMYRKKRNAGGSHFLPALQSFICPITQEVMEDPVEVATGQTFERAAILKWFAAGNKTCPTTKVVLDSLEVKPNMALRHSIEEWKERNIITGIAASKTKLASGNKEEIESALLELHKLSEEKPIHRYWIASEHLIPEVVKLLKFGHRDVRRRALQTLCSLAKNDDNKEEIAAEGAIDIIVRSLARDIGESRQAVALLLELSKLPKLLEEIGKSQGCMLLLVTMLRSEDLSAAEDARHLLNSLSISDSNIVQMAEANHFLPLISRLSQGNDATKVVMASALAKMNLTDESKIVLGKEGAIQPLVNMLASPKLDHQKASLGALHTLSTIPNNLEPMVCAGVLPTLLRLLFAITSGVLTLKEDAAATLANISSWDPLAASDAQAVARFEVLQDDETVLQMLSLLKLTGPSVQIHLLRGLVSMCSKPNAGCLRKKLRKEGAIQTVLEYFTESRVDGVQSLSLKLLFWISGDDSGKELAMHLHAPLVGALVKFISSSRDDEARGAAVGVMANLPHGDIQVTKSLVEADALRVLTDLLSTALARASTKEPYQMLLESITGAFLLFTNPSSVEVQTQVASHDVIPMFVRLLGIGSPVTKMRAATALGQLSENSGKLSRPVQRGNTWCCFGRREMGCVAHGGMCSIRTSFCLIEAEAIGPLIQILWDSDTRVHEAGLGALTTLLYDETWERGVHVIASAQGVRPIVRLLTTGSVGAKEKAVWMLEKFFRFEKYKEEYSAAAQMPLIDLTQKGSPSTRQLAAKILSYLNILHNQSSYF